VSSLDDVKHNSQVENNAAKQTALDHLGVIAAKIRTTVLKFQSETTDNTSKKPLYPLEDVSSRALCILPSLNHILQIVSAVSLRRLNRYLDAHQDVASHLCKRSSEDQAYDVSGITIL
jgi:cohesin loading factor subunit SCC2